MIAEDEARRVEARREECESSGLYFNRYFFKRRFDTKMVIGPHHHATQATLDRTMLPPDHPDFISRLIINVPPGYTKTEQCSIGYMARGLAINPMARFLHLSYSQKLVLLNSATTREIVKSAIYQQMWPRETHEDRDSKEVWHTTDGGGVTASTTSGQVTGFRGGHMDYEKFSGAVVIDDPVKPDDAYSDTIRDGINSNYNETISSRVAIEENPIIVIMQRIHWNDLSGYLLRGGSGEKWHHLCLPMIINNSEKYPAEYTHGIEIDHGLKNGWLWPFKHNAKHEKGLKAHRRKWNAQGLQKPLKRDEMTALWKEKVIARARELDFSKRKIRRTVVAVDPATTNTEQSDDHGIVVASEYDFGKNQNRYSLDADYSRKGSPKEWATTAITAYKQHDADAIVIETNQGGDMCEDTLRNAGFKGKIIRVHAKKGKALRAEPVVALYELDLVSHKAGLGEAEEEMLDFDPITQKSNGHSPNRVDASVYAITELSGVTSDMESLLDMAMGANNG